MAHSLALYIATISSSENKEIVIPDLNTSENNGGAPGTNPASVAQS